MAMFSPYALAADYDALNADALLRKKQQELEQQRVQQEAQKLLGQQIQNALRGTPNQIPQSPAPGQPSQPMQRPQATPMPGGVPQGGAPAPQAAPQAPAMGGAPQQGAQQPAAPQGMPGSALAPVANQFTWQAVLDGLQKVTGAKPEVVARAVQDIMPELDKETDRKFKGEQAEANRQQKSWALLQTLQWRYDRSKDETERAQIKKEMELEVAKLRGQTQEKVANINKDARLGSAQITAGAHERIAQGQTDLKRELGEKTLELRGKQLEETTSYREHVLDLREKGLSQQDAQFQAKQEMTAALANMRDETTRRGQDMVSKDKQAAVAARTAQAAGVQGAKMDAARQKAAFTTDAAVQAIDKSDQMIDKLLENTEGLDAASGPINSRTPDLFEPAVKFATDLKTLKGQLLMQAIAQLKAGSGTTGLGRITNYEAQTIQASMANLERAQYPEDMRKALLNLKNDLSLAKVHTLQGYEQQYAPKTPKPTGGDVPAGQPDMSKAKDIPKEYESDPDGYTYNGPDGKVWVKQGNKIAPIGG